MYDPDMTAFFEDLRDNPCAQTAHFSWLLFS
jgi:hypothetical protein